MFGKGTLLFSWSPHVFRILGVCHRMLQLQHVFTHTHTKKTSCVFYKSDTQTNLEGKKEEGLSPVLSPTFAFSGSEVFTINVRLLSVNTSINTAQCFTSYASFWLSHLFKESSRERKGDGERKRGGRGEKHVSPRRCSAGAAGRVRRKATLTSADEVAAIIAKRWSNYSEKGVNRDRDSGEALGAATQSPFFFFFFSSPGDSWLRLI